MKLLTSRGIGLVGVIVALGLFGVLALLFSQLTRSGLEGQKNVEVRFAAIYLEAEIRDFLANPLNCSETFKNVVVGNSAPPVSILPSSLSKITDSLNSKSYIADNSTLYMNFLVKIKSLVLENVVFDSSSNEQGYLDLKLQFEKQIPGIGNKEISKNVLVKIVLDPPTRKIKYCATALSGFNFPPPAAVKLNDVTATCNQANDGALRYNSALSRPEYCDGLRNAWVSFARKMYSGRVNVTWLNSSANSSNATIPLPSDCRNATVFANSGLIGACCANPANGTKAKCTINPGSDSTNTWAVVSNTNSLNPSLGNYMVHLSGGPEPIWGCHPKHFGAAMCAHVSNGTVCGTVYSWPIDWVAICGP